MKVASVTLRTVPRTCKVSWQTSTKQNSTNSPTLTSIISLHLVYFFFDNGFETNARNTLLQLLACFRWHTLQRFLLAHANVLTVGAGFRLALGQAVAARGAEFGVCDARGADNKPVEDTLQMRLACRFATQNARQRRTLVAAYLAGGIVCDRVFFCLKVFKLLVGHGVRSRKTLRCT